MDINLRRCWLRIDQSRKCLYKKGFCPSEMHRKGRVPQSGLEWVLVPWQEVEPNPRLLVPGASPAQQDARNLRGRGLA